MFHSVNGFYGVNYLILVFKQEILIKNVIGIDLWPISVKRWLSYSWWINDYSHEANGPLFIQVGFL